MNFVLSIVFGLCFTLSVVGQSRPSDEASSVTAPLESEAAIRRLEIEMSTALLTADIKSLDRIWAEEYRFTAPNGVVVNKRQYLALLESKGLTYESLQLGECVVRVYGNVAVLSARPTFKGRLGVHPLEGTDAYQTVYVNRNGVWQQVSTLATRLPRTITPKTEF